EDIKVVCYINSYWDAYPLFSSMHWGDAQIQDDPEIMARWLQQIKNGFLQSSPDLFEKLGTH
ncbi:MAG: endo-1,3-beta-xylanase, partial [Candidatus Omnitrophica bacterium]|nr:endo-1,3-beta-xylanase [Candidatus Omnitrophota bacterium]